MQNDTLARKIQHLQDHVLDQVQDQTDLAHFEQALLVELLDLGKLLTEEFIEQKKVHSKEWPPDWISPGTPP